LYKGPKLMLYDQWSFDSHHRKDAVYSQSPGLEDHWKNHCSYHTSCISGSDGVAKPVVCIWQVDFWDLAPGVVHWSTGRCVSKWRKYLDCLVGSIGRGSIGWGRSCDWSLIRVQEFGIYVGFKKCWL